jgi:hypothetical protein
MSLADFHDWIAFLQVEKEEEIAEWNRRNGVE